MERREERRKGTNGKKEFERRGDRPRFREETAGLPAMKKEGCYKEQCCVQKVGKFTSKVPFSSGA